MRAAEAEIVTGISTDVQKLWRARGYLPSNEKGKRAKFDHQQLILLMICKSLRFAGVDLAKISNLLPILTDNCAAWWMETEGLQSDAYRYSTIQPKNDSVGYFYFKAINDLSEIEDHNCLILLDNESILNLLNIGKKRLSK